MVRYRIIATYNYRKKTKAEAKSLKSSLPKMKNVRFSPIKKMANGYGFTVKAHFTAKTAAIRDMGIENLKTITPNVKITYENMQEVS